MCTRFLVARAEVFGSFHAVGLEAAGQHVGLVPGRVPHGTASPVAEWQMAGIEISVPDARRRGAPSRRSNKEGDQR